MGRNLLDDDEGDEPVLRINESFAQKYEAKKKYEELTKLKTQYGDGYEDDEPPDSESDEEEDEFGELVTPEVDGQIMKTIVSIREKKPEVYDSKVNFFSDDLLSKAGQQWKEKQQAIKAGGKPMRLKDFHRQKLLAGDEEEQEDAKPLTHMEEQEQLKQELKSAFNSFAGDDDEEEDLLKIRTKSEDETKKEEEEYRNFLLENMAGEGGQGIKDWKAFQEVKDDPDEAFLMDYILNRGWMEKGAHKTPTYGEIVGEEADGSEDEEIVEAAEDFERKHNFRFEEEGATDIVTHARNIEGTLRRKDEKRKRQREARAARQEEEKRKKAEELKRLKSLKKEEIREKLKQIQQIAGGDVVGLDEVDLEKDFDPNEHDRKMTEAFGDGYYDAEDANMKPDFGDDIDISDLVGGEGEGGDGVDTGAEEGWDGEWAEGGEGGEEGGEWYGNGQGDNNFIMDADYLPGGEGHEVKEEDTKKKKKDRKGKEKKDKLSLDQYLDEYYQMDYEDMIGDLPTRFKYRPVEADTFGLTPLEILQADDADLNEFYSLKKIAPFRRGELVMKDREKFKKSRKKRLKEFRKKLEERKTEGQDGEAGRKDGWTVGGEGAGVGKKRKREREGGVREETVGPVDKVEVKEEGDVPASEGEKKKKKKKKAADEVKEEVKAEIKEEGGSRNGEGATDGHKKKKFKKTHDQNGFKSNKIGKPGGKGKAGLSADRLASYQMPKKK
ncbi:KRRI-Interacting protein 1 [Rhizophlyctis rosea]|nr:KRRI-Interacting protein 1 [Rhizophlyctis rosea]